jgi:predicted ATPase
VLQEIATRLEVTDIGGAGIQEALIAFLEPLDLFMVLDNFEQVMTATPLVAELLAACPRLTVLATSRAPLRLRAEREFPVPPLAENEAVRLFVERGQAVKPEFRLTAETLPVVAAIVSRVDGLPLAIELAAARVRGLPPAALLARLEQRLPLLSGGPRDLPLRQQTMRDTIAWSYDLLTPAEQVFFRQLAVFVGGFALEAAEAFSAAVTDATGDLQSFAPYEVVDGITSLIDHSLLRQSAASGDEPRYTMLETVREFGLERLEAGGKTEEHAVRGAHAAWCLALAEGAEAGLSSPEQLAWLDRLEAEHDNLRAALAWSLEQEDGELALRLSTALEPFWQIRGYPGEGLAWIEQALAKGTDAASTIRARALQRLGRLAIDIGDFDRAQAVFEAGLALRRQVGDRLGVAQSLAALGFIASHRDAFPKARAFYEEALAIHRDLDDQHGIARSLYNLSDLLREEGDLAAARRLCQDSLVLWQELGDTDMVAYLTWSQAVVDRLEGRSADASRRGEEALALFRELRDLPGIDNALLELGQTALQRGDLQQAAHHFGEVLTRNRELGSRQALVEGLEGLAAVAAGRGQFALAARLLGAATAEREVKRFPVVPRGDGPALEARIEAARTAALEAWEAAQTLPLEQIVVEALTSLPSSELAHGGPARQ